MITSEIEVGATFRTSDGWWILTKIETDTDHDWEDEDGDRFISGSDGLPCNEDGGKIPGAIVHRVSCDQCQMLSINGVACHETGCPNMGATWVPDRGWVKYVECFICGCEVEKGETCDCQDEPEGCDECMTYPCSCDDAEEEEE